MRAFVVVAALFGLIGSVSTPATAVPFTSQITAGAIVVT
jgi:hypothetical protein